MSFSCNSRILDLTETKSSLFLFYFLGISTIVLLILFYASLRNKNLQRHEKFMPLFDILMGGIAIISAFQFVCFTYHYINSMFTQEAGAAQQIWQTYIFSVELRILAFSALFIASAWTMKSICRLKFLSESHLERIERIMVLSFVGLSTIFAIFMIISAYSRHIEDRNLMIKNQHSYKNKVLEAIQKIKNGDSRDLVRNILWDIRWEKINPDSIKIHIPQVEGIDRENALGNVIVSFKNDSVSEISKGHGMSFY
jgi:membrane protein implicated in regulation of membrane protease activity